MDLTMLDNVELDALLISALEEQERRRIVAEAPKQAEDIAIRYASAIGRQDGDQWIQPTGAHDAYALDAIVTYDGKMWESTTPNNTWKPGVSGWREKVADGHPAWIQPTGAHDAYNRDGAKDIVTHVGKTWRSTVPNNVWEPGVYGWVEV